MPKLFLAIPYAVAVRDVLRSQTFDVLCARSDLEVVVLAPEGELATIAREFSRPNVRFEPLQKFSTSFVERLLYRFVLGFLYHKSRTLQVGSVSGMSWSLQVMAPLAKVARLVLGERQVMKLMTFCFRHLTPTRLYKELFARIRPDLVVVTRVLGFSLDYPIMKRAQVEGVPVVALVSSWDNLTSKGFFAFDVSRLVVWNEVMKEEAVDLFHYPPDRVFISGIPRYDVFFSADTVRSRDAFLRALGMDPSKKLVTYATGSKNLGLCPEDPVTPEPEICEFLADAISSGVIPGAQLLVRLHPQADPAQYARLMSRKDVVVDVPGSASAFVDRLFTQDDDWAFAELMHHSSVVVNLFSTVTLDAVACDTPVVCVNFDFRGPRPLLRSVTRYAQFDHYAKLAATGCVGLAGSREELVEKVAKYLMDPSIDSRARQQARERYCVFTDGSAGKRAAQLILDALDETITPHPASPVRSAFLEGRLSPEGTTIQGLDTSSQERDSRRRIRIGERGETNGDHGEPHAD